jgi:hypothetical protein
MKRKPRGSSKAGRPRKKDVARNASGRIVQRVDPNERVVELRKALLPPAKDGNQIDISQADDPMDLAHARGWLSTRQVTAGRRYAALYAASHPSKIRKAEHEAPPEGERDARSWSQVPDAEIVMMFDKMMDATARQSRPESAAVRSRTLYLSMTNALSPREQLQVFNCFCLRSWPQWLIWQCAGKVIPPEWTSRRAELNRGLDVLDALLTRKPKRANLHIVEMKSSVWCA